jgi:hypothetical protein
MATVQPAYTDRVWKSDMSSMTGLLSERMAPVMERMLASLKALDAGDTQIRLFTIALGRVSDLATQGHAILTEVGARYNPVNEAQAAAGGLREVYGEKTAHQNG